jgi:hypothetical protein
MKTKVTLSLNQRTVAMLRKAGARKAKPMSAIVDELVEELDRKDAAKTDDDLAWIDEMGTWLSGKFTEKDLQDDPRLAYSFGYKPQEMKKKRSRTK